MANSLEITGPLLTRNWGLNLLGLGAPVLVALGAMPYLVRGLGVERFGILSLIWIVLGNSVVFDLGLGRATIKFTAECLGREDVDKLPGVVWTSIWLQMAMGFAFSFLTAACVPILVNRLLHISPLLIHDTEVSFFILTASWPILLTTAGLRGVLEAGQHFGAVNAVKIPVSISLFLFPMVGVALRANLTSIVLLLVAGRLASLGIYFALCIKFYPKLRHCFQFERSILRLLLSYGSWVTVTNVAAPLLTQLDRFFIGSLLSLSAVGYYSAPYEAISRAWVIPGSLASTLFPAFASLEAGGSRKRIQELCARSLKSLLLTLVPIFLLIIILAPTLLRVWLGQDFAAHGARLLQILAVGMLLNSLGLIPFSLIQGVGRADLTAKFMLLEVVCYVPGLLFLLKHFGLPGAAIAFTLRCAADTLILFVAAVWLESVTLRSFLENGLRRSCAAVFLFAAALPGIWLARDSPFAQFVLSVALTSLFGLGVWSYVLDGRDRLLLLTTAAQFRNIIWRT